jgi:2-dehydro-3-deoxyphosphogluconate aldolase/(4S)-4-hydroxy-2-oxoglutarate aldolase
MEIDLNFNDALQNASVVGVLRAPSAEAAIQAALAAVRGGLTALEMTFTTPNAEDAIHELAARLPPTVLLGAGTVMNELQARAAIDAGAQFLVSPHLSEEVWHVALKLQIPYIPGVLTPSEIARALRLGASTLKIFPIGSSGGQAYLKDLLAPFPELKVMVTGGIAPTEVRSYLNAGALAVGLGSNFFPSLAVQNADWLAVENATRNALLEVNTA